MSKKASNILAWFKRSFDNLGEERSLSNVKNNFFSRDDRGHVLEIIDHNISELENFKAEVNDEDRDILNKALDTYKEIKAELSKN